MIFKKTIRENIIKELLMCLIKYDAQKLFTADDSDTDFNDAEFIIHAANDKDYRVKITEV